MLRRDQFKQRVFEEGIMLPGVFNALTARMVAQIGFEGLYISGAALSASAGLPDIGLLSMMETGTFASYIVNAVKIPCICDVDTGFGGVDQVEETVKMCEKIGLAGIQLEDQSMPKRCGHLQNKRLVSTDIMCEKIQRAVHTRRDPNFLVIARTDARSVEGLPAVIDRSSHYIDAGADLIFPEALNDEAEFQFVSTQLNVPLMANMTEFGVSPLISFQQLNQMGYKMVIYPVSALRVAMKACEQFYQQLLMEGGQKNMVANMQTRKELYQLLGYKPDMK